MTTPERDKENHKSLELTQGSTRDKHDTLPPNAGHEIQDKTLKLHREEILQGKTLQIYWYILRHNRAGVREIQKNLNISSTGTMSYQINKLVKAGLILKNRQDGKYYVQANIKKGLLRFYAHLGPFLIPRFSLYLTIDLLGFIGYLIFSTLYGIRFITSPGGILFLLTLLFSTAAFIYESRKLWHKPPA
jgi:predicted DNA-binding transcriptional regulator